MSQQTPEIKWDKPEAFSLVAQSTTDGDRVAREKAKREADKRNAEKQQRKMI